MVTFGGNVWMQAEAKVADETLCPGGGAHPEEEWTEKLAVCIAASRQNTPLALREHHPYNMNTSVF